LPYVKLDKGASIDRVLRKLKKQLEKEGLFKELKKREYYEKPNQRRRKKYLKAMKKIAYAKKHAEF
jgi:small subunit ribosomal protein S21